MKDTEIEVLKRLKAAGLNSDQIRDLDRDVNRSDWGKGQAGPPEKPNVKPIKITKPSPAAVGRRMNKTPGEKAGDWVAKGGIGKALGTGRGTKPLGARIGDAAKNKLAGPSQAKKDAFKARQAAAERALAAKGYKKGSKK